MQLIPSDIWAQYSAVLKKRQFWGHHTNFLTLDLPRHIISAWQELQES